MQARATATRSNPGAPNATGSPESRSWARMRSARGMFRNEFGTPRRMKKVSKKRS
jgi:hypothetical protein